MENEVDKRELKKYYSLLEGIEEILGMYYSYIPDKLVYMYNDYVKNIRIILHDDIVHNFILDKDESDYDGYHIQTLSTKIIPLMKYIKDNYLDDDVVKLGTLCSNIKNHELQKRCLDILSCNDAYDRVINQATMVLENAIREKSKITDDKIHGMNLVSKAINSKKETTYLLFSEDAEVQEGYSYLYKGVIGAYRNRSHHKLDYKITREDALKCCAFIDFLLKELEHSKNIKDE